jgi:hypothetical protein
MENEFENEFNDNSTDLKSLEEFFSKEINNLFTPQEIMILSLSLNHIANVLNLYSMYSDVAIFDVKAFIEKHPEYANIDFNNLKDLDEDTLKTIEDALYDKNGSNGEEFNKGDILIKNIITTILSASSKLYNTYTKEYSKISPPDTEPFFTMLENCLQSSLSLLTALFTPRP